MQERPPSPLPLAARKLTKHMRTRQVQTDKLIKWWTLPPWPRVGRAKMKIAPLFKSATALVTFIVSLCFELVDTMPSSESSSSTSSKPRIRISIPSRQPSQPTPVRQQQNDDRHRQVSPTPLRTTTDNSKRPAARLHKNRALPYLSPRLLEGLRNGDLEFPINEECKCVLCGCGTCNNGPFPKLLNCRHFSTGTSLKIIPTGRLIVGGFTDGTLRLFDLSCPAFSQSSLESSDYSEGESSLDNTAPKNVMVCSKAFQRYGAVACQIHARGVHTSLLMHVDCSEDGLYCFGGVIRGSMELVAVNLSNIHRQTSSGDHKDLLDLIQVHRHSDAKLKGFGACTRIAPNKYLLLTGKGIKNIHIWSFAPKEQNQWQCLYDTQTNGNTISILHWRYDPNGLLQAWSKSDSQKLRVWDLSHEQHQGDAGHALYNKTSVVQQLAKQNTPHSKGRPKRPPYVDVASTESALGIAGAFCFGGGYNQVSVVSLDVENVSSPYNHTEMALPGFSGERTNRRQQRGDLQSIVRVAGMSRDADHVLLELSNVCITRVHHAFDVQSVVMH